MGEKQVVSLPQAKPSIDDSSFCQNGRNFPKLLILLSLCRRSEILGEVQKQGSTKLPSNKSVLVVGDNASGKTSLIAKLQGVEDPKKGSGLEYAYIDVRDEYRDGKSNIFIHSLTPSRALKLCVLKGKPSPERVKRESNLGMDYLSRTIFMPSSNVALSWENIFISEEIVGK